MRVLGDVKRIQNLWPRLCLDSNCLGAISRATSPELLNDKVGNEKWFCFVFAPDLAS